MKRLISTFMVTAMLAAPALAGAASITHSLSIGSRGQDVTALQHMLITLGYLKTSPSGYFGVLTKQAVVAYQKGHGIDPVGVVGPKTRQAIGNDYNAAVSSSTNIPSPPTPAIVSTTTLPVSTPPLATSSATTSVPASTPPTDPNAFTISVVSPAATLPSTTLNTTLVVATNKNAMCRWGTLPGATFTSMTMFQTTGGTTHSYYFPYLARGSLYVYYVKCQDSTSNIISPDTQVSFTVSS